MVVAPGVVELHRGARPAFLDGRGEARQTGDEIVALGADVPRVGGELVDGGVAGGDQSGAPGGALRIEAEQPLADLVIAAHVEVHRRHDDAVVQRHAVDDQWFEQGIGHKFSVDRESQF